MKYRFMRDHSEYPLSKWAIFFNVSQSGFYSWQQSLSSRTSTLKRLKDKIRRIFDSSRGTYGAERICGVLRKEGVKSSYRRVKRLMDGMGLYSVHTRHRSHSLTDSSKARDDSYKNHAKGLIICRPMKLVTSDISYIRTKEGFVYLCAVRDAFTGLVLSHTCSERMTKELVLSAIRAAGLPKGVIFHSDRGSQYTASDVQCLLRRAGIIQSFSRVGKPGDNAWGESFFSILKKESVHQRQFATRTEAKLAMFDYIEGFYNSNRVQRRLGYISPRQFVKDWNRKGYKKVA